MKRKLPLGIQSFEKLREGNCVYIDKTEDIYRLVTDGSIYFLSRPRRFGKSLLISTLDALFSGRKELFEGLYIYDKWDWTQKYPLIRIDWTNISHAEPEEMKVSLRAYLQDIARKHGISLTRQTPSDCFGELIEQLHEKTGQKAVILIDEYDKPVTSHLFD
ncbi:MAG: AAA family ATPase, partial [Tannerella sp.]|nr:AAA family ATPase [Tannerella sp.]